LEIGLFFARLAKRLAKKTPAQPSG